MDVLALTRRLVAFDTINPPGNEAAAVRFCGDLLAQAGFACRYIDHMPARCSLVATRGTGTGRALAFSGHLDTVPLGAAAWQRGPFDGEIVGDRLYGRGTTDMKGGIAAFLIAAIEAKEVPGGAVLLLSAGEETGSDGARWMVEAGDLPDVGALVVAEPTANLPRQGHKGVLWLRLTARGVTAHGSMPHEGVNAIQKAAAAVRALEGFEPGAPHPAMGPTSSSVGTIRGGLNTNSVPDHCEVTLDLRTVAGVGHAEVLGRVRALVGPGIEVTPIIDLPPVWTSPEHPWMRKIASLHARRTGGVTAGPGAMPYFTDASYLKAALGDPPTLILGPGEPELAHQTDEWISTARLHEAKALYAEMLRDWTGEAS